MKKRRSQKQYYDAKYKEAAKYVVGDKVWKFNPEGKVGKSKKLLHRWNGPYEIIEVKPPLNYNIKRIGGRKPPKVVHVKMIKPYFDPATRPTYDITEELTEEELLTAQDSDDESDEVEIAEEPKPEEVTEQHEGDSESESDSEGSDESEEEPTIVVDPAEIIPKQKQQINIQEKVQEKLKKQKVAKSNQKNQSNDDSRRAKTRS